MGQPLAGGKGMPGLFLPLQPPKCNADALLICDLPNARCSQRGPSTYASPRCSQIHLDSLVVLPWLVFGGAALNAGSLNGPQPAQGIPYH
eukprot:1160803-Pelagomonas_calceolata.AAC.20